MSSGLVSIRTSKTCLPCAAPGLGVTGVEGDDPGGGARPCSQALGEDLGLLDSLRLALFREHRAQQLSQLLRIDAHERLLRRDRAGLAHLDGDADGGETRALAVARLQHEEPAALDRELEVLHVVQLALESLPNLQKLLVDLGERLPQLADGARSAYSGDHVLALGVHQELPVEDVLAGGWIAGEGDAGAGLLAGVAVHHGLHVDRRAPVVGNGVEATIGDGPVVGPAPEHGRDRAPELLHRVVRKVLARALPDGRLERDDGRFEIVRVKAGIHLDAPALLHRLEDLREGVALVLVLWLAAEHYVAVHSHEAPVAVVGEAWIAGGRDDALHRIVVQPEVEDRVHHARHAGAGARTHREQQRVGRVTERLAGVLLERHESRLDLRDGALGVAAVERVRVADLGRDREARRHGKADPGHLGEIRPLAAEQGLHLLVALTETVDVLARHQTLLRNPL